MPSIFKKPLNLWLGLIAFAMMFLLMGLNVAPLMDWDENIYAEASRQMVVRHDYLRVYLNDFPFAEKPPLFFWLQALSYHLFDVSEASARLPSACVGLLVMSLCFWVGTFLESALFGWLWGLIYLTSLLPAFLGRSAVIDHTFNGFILTSCLCLYFYDQLHRHYQLQQKKPVEKGLDPPLGFWTGFREALCRLQKKLPQHLPDAPTESFFQSTSYHRVFLILASITMGLSVLTKGPLGGVIPLVGFITYKAFYRFPKIPVIHMISSGILSLSLVVAWYGINGWFYGSQFLQGFIQFQWALFSQPLEGHQGPFYYHLFVIFWGFFPWTPFLLVASKEVFSSGSPHFRPLMIGFTGWAVFVLILFSVVQTKLPHYSASIYFPLSFLTAWIVYFYHQSQRKLPLRMILLYGGMGVLLGLGILYIPMGIKSHFESLGIEFSRPIPPMLPFTGIVVLLMTGLGVVVWAKKKIITGVVVMCVGTLLWTQGMWRGQIPFYLDHVQTPMLELVQEAHQNGSDVVFYRYVSFAALFYGKRPIEMLHTYKFPGNPDRLNHPHDPPDWVITERRNQKSILQAHPRLVHLKDSGNFSVFINGGS